MAVQSFAQPPTPEPLSEPRRYEAPILPGTYQDDERWIPPSPLEWQAPAPSAPAKPARASTHLTAHFPAPSPASPSAWLICESGAAAGMRYPVDQREFWIGALPANNLAMPDDPTVSSYHACVVFDHDVLRIHDHQSTNGTVVNGEALSGNRRLLWPGDRIQIGRSTFVLQSVEDSAGNR